MSDNNTGSDRRQFINATGAGFAIAGLAATTASDASARTLTEKDKLARIASNTWPVRSLFKRRPGGRSNPEGDAMKKKYGEITMLDFPQFTKDIFPGVHHMDLWSSLFGDVTDNSMFASQTYTRGDRTRTFYEFDPSTPSAKKWSTLR